MPDIETILEKSKSLRPYYAWRGDEPDESNVWRGQEGDLRFSLAQEYPASHAGDFNYCLYVWDGTSEERERVINDFIEALGQPDHRDRHHPDELERMEEHLAWPWEGRRLELAKKPSV